MASPLLQYCVSVDLCRPVGHGDHIHRRIHGDGICVTAGDPGGSGKDTVVAVQRDGGILTGGADGGVFRIAAVVTADVLTRYIDSRLLADAYISVFAGIEDLQQRAAERAVNRCTVAVDGVRCG